MKTVQVYSLVGEGSRALSQNFKVREFRSTDGADAIFVDPKLVEVLQSIRSHFGRPVVITSGYRTHQRNRAVGGATLSQHLYGTAADIQISGVKPADAAAYAETLLPDTGGIGIYSWGIHVDTRDVKSRWNG